MLIKTVTVLKPDVRVINIDTGKPKALVVGRDYPVESVSKGRAYYVLAGTRQGAINRFWEDAERGGKVRLTYAREASDASIDAVALPITSKDQLTAEQYRTMVIGKLVKGKFRCNRCAAEATLSYPEAINVYPINVLPYSQRCGACGLQIVAIWKSARGGWLNLHD